MRRGVCFLSMVLCIGASALAEDAGTSAFANDPVPLLLQQQADNVYAPSPPGENAGVNAGGVNFDLAVSYFTDYVFRGFERFDAILPHEDSANLQIEAKLSFNLGPLPHPFIGVFVNAAESDPVSNFQEIRPFFGAEWTLRPLILAGGHTTFIFPDRDQLSSSEVWGRIAIDDSYFLHTQRPLLSPYVYAAYDYDNYHGWYFEAGVQHDFVFEDVGVTLTASASMAYVQGLEPFALRPGNDSGFQHYQIGLVGKYSLNRFFDVSSRYGQWTLNGYLFYTDGMSNDLRATTQIWGGAGIGFEY